MSDAGRLIFHSKYDKTKINDKAESRINLDNTVNMCLNNDGFLTACSGWRNLIKVKKIVPYTFCIPQHLWDHIKRRQPFEYDMALRYGLEFDLRQIDGDNPGFIYTDYFHTMMYLNFATYLRKNAKGEAGKAVSELMGDTFKIRVAAHYKKIEEIVELTPAGYGVFEKAKYTGYAMNNMRNRGPFMISSRLYEMIFGKKWNKQAYELCQAEGYITPNSDEYDKLDK